MFWKRKKAPEKLYLPQPWVEWGVPMEEAHQNLTRAIQSVQVQEGNLTYTIGTPNCKEETNARHSKCSGCGSSEFKTGRCVYCRSYR